MGIIKYTLLTFKRDLKQSLFYIGSMVISIAVIFNAFNVIFNENIIAREGIDYQLMCILGVIVQAVAILFMLFANSYYIEDNYKEYGIITISGKSVYEISMIIVLRSLISTIISVILGCLLGSILCPLVNQYIYNIAGFKGNINYISPSGVVMTFLIMVIQFMCVGLTNTGSVYRKKVNELMNKKNEPFIPDKRVVKLPVCVYILIFLLPVALCIMPINAKDKMVLLNFLIVVSSFGTQGIVRYVIPNIISNCKEKVLINDKIKLIWISNLNHSIQKSRYLILALILSATFSISIACRYDMGSILNVASLGCFIVAIVIMSFTIVYKFLVDAVNRKKNVSQLILLGYTRNEIKIICRKEVSRYYFIIISISLVHILVLAIAAVLANVLSILTCMYLILGYTLLFISTSVLSYIGYKRIVL